MINKNTKTPTISIILVLATCLMVLLFTLVFSVQKSFSASVDTVNVSISDDDGASVYVSGDGVYKTENGYTAKAGSSVTVTVINEKRLFSSVTIGQTKYYEPIVVVNVPNDESLKIEVETVEPYAENKGEYFGNPFLISQEADILALQRILKGTASLSDFLRFGESEQTISKIVNGYFRLTTNLFINDESFSGLGSRSDAGRPFQGCFDFGGYSITLAITRTQHVSAEFIYNDVEALSIADYGFFAYVYGNGKNPCLIRNADVSGFIAINTANSDVVDLENTRVNAGGLAGTVGKNVLLDRAISQVSVSGYMLNASLYIGGVFGICSTNIETWSNVSYEGFYSNVSGVTLGEQASVYAGGFAGVVQNVRINNFVVDVSDTNVIANSLNKKSGSSIAGGFAGSVVLRQSALVEISVPQTMSIKNTLLKLNGKFSVESIIHNSESEHKASIDPDSASVNQSFAVSGGVIGTVYRDSGLKDDSKIELSGNRFVNGEDRLLSKSRLSVNASTEDASSSGSVFAGGYTGYIFSDGVKYVHYVSNDKNLSDEHGNYVFDCAVDITATQNGVGPAYAGGLFGYNAFLIDAPTNGNIQFHVCSKEYDYTVSAVQSAMSNKYGNAHYDVVAGGFTSRIYPGYSAKNITFELGNCLIRAYREAGSTAVGDIASGGYAGIASNSGTILGNHSKTLSGEVENFTLLYEENSTIESACYSFDSNFGNVNGKGQTIRGNNVYAGGIVGLVIGYKKISNVVAKYEGSGGMSNEFFVHAVQNAVSGNDDLKTEGYAGGVFGLTMDCIMSNIRIEGDSEGESLVYLESNNNPNTASIGGLVGAVWTWWLGKTNVIDQATVRNVHVAGKAYHTTKNDQYDIYVGGAVGILGTQNTGWNNAENKLREIIVDGCTIEAIGENQMLTYSAGIVGGIWWKYAQYLEDSVVINSSITSSSVSQKAYAGGLVGIAQVAYIRGCAVIDTDIRAISPYNEASAFGLFAWAKDFYSVNDNYSNATLKAEGRQGSSYFAGIGHLPYYANDNNYNKSHSGNVFVSENAGTDVIYQNVDRYKYAKGVALFLDEDKNNKIELSEIGSSRKVYPSAYTTTGSGTNVQTKFTVEVRTSDPSVATVEQREDGYYYVTATGKGTAYVSAWCTVAGQSYELCTYPVIVSDGKEITDFSLDLTDSKGNILTSDKVNSLYEYVDGTINYQYVKHLVCDSTIGDFCIFPLVDGERAIFPSEVTLYDVTAKSGWSDDGTERIASIIANKGKKVERSTFNGRLTILTTGDAGSRKTVAVSVKNSISDNVIIVLEYTVGNQTYGVIVEYVPNKIVGIDLSPDAGTPAHDEITIDGKKYYVYAPGDVVRFDAKIIRRFSGMREYVVDTVYSGKDVMPNGTVVVSGDRETYEVTCSTIDGNATATAYILVRKQVSVLPNLNGATFTAESKMIMNSAYSFTVKPQGGYGLLPTVSFTVKGVNYSFEFDSSQASVNYKGRKYVVPFEYSSSDGGYKMTLGKELTLALANDVDEFEINVKFDKTFAYVFVSNYGDNQAYRIEIASGTALKDVDFSGFYEWQSKLTRYGYDLQGFYLVSSATNLSDFGTSFDGLCGNESEYVNGFLKFYARWTYSIIVESPSFVEVKSSFSYGSLSDGKLVPVSDKIGFGFALSIAEGYSGSPRFDAYIRKQNGVYERITDLFEKYTLENSFYVSNEKLSAYESGLFYIKVYSDSLTSYVGDGIKYDGNKLYSDGIFTLEYSVNYGANDDVGDVEFDFGSLALPKGTSLRLYYQKDGVPAWAGGKILERSATYLAINSFLSMSDGKIFANEIRQNARREKFALVVTLPSGSDFDGAENGLDATIRVAGFDAVSTRQAYGLSAQKYSDEASLGVVDSQTELVFFKSTKHKVSVSDDKKVIYTVENNAIEGVIDHKHSGSVFLFKVERAEGGAIGNANFDYIGTEIVRTTTAVYFTATDKQSFSAVGLTGYKLSLIEVKNAQQPAEGKVLFERLF